MNVETIFEEYQKLSEADKQKLLTMMTEQNSHHLDGGNMPEGFWNAMDKRMADMDSGQDSGVTSEQLHKDIRAALANISE